MGVLQGTISENQTWQYDPSTYKFISVPNATVKPTVPVYSWPNYWSNLSISPPAYNSQYGEYASSVQEDLNLSVPTPIGALSFETCNCYLSVHFNASGGAYGTAYWN